MKSNILWCPSATQTFEQHTDKKIHYGTTIQIPFDLALSPE